jgi:hypothetical protein
VSAGFLFLAAFKIYFEKRIKTKTQKLPEQFGFYAWVSPQRTGSQRNP